MVQIFKRQTTVNLLANMRILQVKSVTEQVDEILLERIRSGVYLPGSRIPSESELSDELGVSRATVRTVLAKLAANGFITRKQGDGTYVNEHARRASAHFGNLWDLTQLIEGNGYVPSIRLISMKKRPATEKEALVLALEAGGELLCLRRLFYADQRAVILADNVIPVSLLCAPLETLDGGLHIRDILDQYFHQKIAFVLTGIRATVMEQEMVEFLGGEAGRPILELQTTFYEKNNMPLALGVNIFDDSFLHLSLAQAWN
ncbi:MAG: GntR family transcriptional regulator [Chloroflexi bacterium]|nr:GntR family transcriptional regulator [Chloroflexota bacterium]